MRKDIVIELSYKRFGWSGDNSWGHYNHSKSQILTPLLPVSLLDSIPFSMFRTCLLMTH